MIRDDGGPLEEDEARTLRIDVRTRFLCSMIEDHRRTGKPGDADAPGIIGMCCHAIGELLKMTLRDGTRKCCCAHNMVASLCELSTKRR